MEKIKLHACIIHTYVHIYIHACMGYVLGTGALPDVRTQLPGGAQHPRTGVDILGRARVPGI